MVPSERQIDEAAALKAIVQGTSAETGKVFFESLVENLARAIGVHGAWVTEFLPDEMRLKSFAFWLGGDWIPDYEYAIAGTPCEPVIDSESLYHVPDKVIELYPDDPDLAPAGAVSYMGVPLKDTDGNILGHLAVLDNRPMPEDARLVALFSIFASRATAELQRLRAEKAIREREEKLARLVDGAMDAIVDLDARLDVSLLNPAAEKILGCEASAVVGSSFTEFLADESCEKIDQLIEELTNCEDASALWIPGGLRAVRSDDSTLSAEATLSRSSRNGQQFYTLILRDVNDRLEAERKIEALTDENQRLERELDELREHHGIIGKSKAMRHALLAVEKVAATDASVLLLGETGTGKELFARAIHEASTRSRKALVKVNCAAIPANLIESEFFGHEKGAFTGATGRREGRFALADGGTILLDEIGELPIDLQSKLLRVLQEGEFEPVGGAETRSVDVRVIAATNRDLKARIEAGKFREDLYFRLNVFPIEIPALRERGGDVELIATAFVERLCRKMNRPCATLSDSARRHLGAYAWPGNVRELQNVIERALISSPSNLIHLDRALPESGRTTPSADEPEAILTTSEVQEFERANYVRALESCGWRISGKQGAAALLGMKPTTLTSRLKALGIERP